MNRFIRLALYLALGLILGASATLASAASTFGSASTKGMKGGAWNGSGTIDSGRTAKTIETVNVGGKYIPVPMLGSVGAAALEAVIIGLKATPKALVIGGVISYLTNKGFDLMGDQLQVKKPDIPAPDPDSCWMDAPNGVSVCQPSAEAVCAAREALLPHLASYRWETVVLTSTTAKCNVYINSLPDVIGWPHVVTSTPAPCPSGYVLSVDGKSCLSTEYTGPHESDWDKIRNDPPLPEVMKDLCQQLSAIGSSSYACPVTNQRTEPVTEPLTDWKTDPVTGQQNRQFAKISPAPTPENPERVEITIEKEVKTPASTNPDGSTVPEKTETKNDETSDFCVLHPNSLACAELGEPEDIDLQKDTRNISITPDGGWGASSASCPSPKTHTLKNGYTVTQSWQPVCDSAAMFRPVVIGMAWLAAIYSLLAIQRKAQS